MAPKSPYVSIIIPTFNARDFVSRAIQSALDQTFDDLEIIVVDDGSSDGSGPFVRQKFGNESRLKLLELRSNFGPSFARNVGIDAATGQWVAVLDADDFWRSNRLEKLSLQMADRDFIFDNLVGYDFASGLETGEIFPVFPGAELTLPQLLSPVPDSAPYNYGYLKPMMRLGFLNQHQLRYDVRIRTGEDRLLFTHALLSGAKTATVSEALYVYSTPVGRLSGRASAANRTEPPHKQLAEAYLSLVRGDNNLLTSSQKLLIRRFSKTLEAEWLQAHLIAHSKNREYLAFARTVAQNPRALTLLLMQRINLEYR